MIDFTFQLLKENVITSETELETFKRLLTTDYPECLESQREGVQNISLQLLRILKEKKLTDILESSKKLFIHIFTILLQSSEASALET